MSPLRSLGHILLVGPPGSGKSTIARGLVEKSGIPWLNLDLYAVKEAAQVEHRGALSDYQIDVAVTKLLAGAADCRCAIVELPHHDYQTLFQRQSSFLLSVAICGVVWCKDTIALDRNR